MVDWLGFDFRVTIAVEAVQPERTGRYFRGSQFGVRVNNGGHNLLLHFLVVAQRGIEFPFAFAFLVRKFQHRPVVCVRAGDEGVLYAGLGFDPLPNRLQ